MLKTPSVMSSLRCDRGSSDDPARGVDVLVREDLDRRAAQAAAVDDARVVQLVGDDDVFFRRMAETVPAFAVNPLWNTTTFSTFLKSASRRSSSMWISMVPAMVRTEPVPTPKCSIASSARSRSLRMGGQAEIVVRRQVDDRFVIDGRVRLLLVHRESASDGKASVP